MLFNLFCIYYIFIWLFIVNSNGNRNGNSNNNGNADYTEQTPYISWLHIQKTSSWLGRYINIRFCSNVTNVTDINPKLTLYPHSYDGEIHNCTTRVSQDYHWPYGQVGLREYHVKNRTILAMFREPRDRLISAFLYIAGGMYPSGFPNHGSLVKKKIRQNVLNSTVPIMTYSRIPGIQSCQYKMLYGYLCGQPVEPNLYLPAPYEYLPPVSRIDLRRRLEHDILAFGLTNEFHASHALLEILVPKYYNQYIVNHTQFNLPRIRTSLRNVGRKHDSLEQDLIKYGWEDTPDNTLYEVAKEIFCERCMKYNIPTQHC